MLYIYTQLFSTTVETERSLLSQRRLSNTELFKSNFLKISQTEIYIKKCYSQNTRFLLAALHQIMKDHFRKSIKHMDIMITACTILKGIKRINSSVLSTMLM